MNTTTAYGIRWKNLWWTGSKAMIGQLDEVGSPFITDATLLTDSELAEDIAKELGGIVKRVDLVTE